MGSPNSAPEVIPERRRNVLLVAVIALAAVGYVVGLRAGVPEGRSATPVAGAVEVQQPSGTPARPAVSYDDVGAGALRAPIPPMAWETVVDALRAPETKPVTDPSARDVSLRTRAERRAYNGAPPVIPHQTRGLADRDCTSCHAENLQLGDRVARVWPHPFLTSCTQCHVPQTEAFFDADVGLLAESTWAGIPAPFEGPRASPGAPPTVPHTLWMRTDCKACHGPHGWPGMQTSHPERSNCLQCHAPSEDRSHPGRDLDAPTLLPPPRMIDR